MKRVLVLAAETAALFAIFWAFVAAIAAAPWAVIVALGAAVAVVAYFDFYARTSP